LDHDRHHLRWAALLASISLSVLFLVGYTFTNRFTATRGDVGVWMYEWERFIPFVPLMIVPYMSIDLFFVVGPFLCSDRRELAVLSKRIALAIIVACALFLLMPLKLGVERPAASGWLGAVFDWFRAMDQPHNLFPSLHIALRTILADLYARHTRGVWRVLSHLWFSLIGLSTLLTYQHHVIDIVGGFALATVCFYVIPTVIDRTRVPANPRLGWRYLIGALVILPLAGSHWFLFRAREIWFLLWPAMSLALVGLAYLRGTPGIYQKSDGRMSIAALVLLGPVHFGEWLSLLYYRTRGRAWDRVSDDLLIGRRLTRREARRLISERISAVIDLTAEFTETPMLRKGATSLPYLNLQVLDLTSPTQEQIAPAMAFIRLHAPRGPVYLHCKAGYSRSAVIAGAHLLDCGEARDVDDAVKLLRERRPRIVIRPEAMAALRAFASSRE